MFYVCVLQSAKTGRRYVGSCENLDERVRRHNFGHSKATRHGIPWTLVYSESFSSRADATRKERYYKSGRGRDELDFMSQTDFKYDCCFYGQSVSGPELLTLAVFLGEPDKYAESQSVFCHRGRFRHRVSKSVPLLTGIAD
jgi:putative endonuclease